jgi:hypothetical protein
LLKSYLARTLNALAGRSVVSRQTTQVYKLHLKELLAEYNLACTQLQDVERGIVSVLEHNPCAKSLLAVKGISDFSLASILGEAGDLSGFVHRIALMGHAELNLAEVTNE